MNANLEKAKNLLKKGGYTCVLCNDDVVYTSDLRGVQPLLKWLEADVVLRDFSAADKVVGKATALLYVLTGIKEIYAPVISVGAVEVCKQHQIQVVYEVMVDKIINHAGNDNCPMEKAVKNIDSPTVALQVIKATMKTLQAQSAKRN